MNESLQQFARQLSVWTEEIIDHGRTPFRRVETNTTIETANGSIKVPLILWINRQSMMAGGIILLPQNNLEEEKDNGRRIAKALGLKHFVTWERQQVRVWLCEQEEITEQRCFQLTDPDYLETFRFVLEDLLDALKLTAVLGAVPPAELSSDYFHNLAQITLQQTLPSLVDVFRSHRSGDGQTATTDIDQCASESNRIVLLQIMSLLWLGEIPMSIMPEKLEMELRKAIEALPQSIREPLALTTISDPPQLPMEAAVAFHHFLLRLRQVAWNKTETRIKATLVALSQAWFADSRTDPPSCEICLYPQRPPVSRAHLVVSDSPSLLAMTVLLQHAEDRPLATLIFNNLFKLEREKLPPTEISARLLNHRPLVAGERTEIVTQLRRSWPHRRFKIRAGQPFWYWELIHLLGISHPDQTLCMTIPLHVLRAPVKSLIWALLAEHFCLQEIDRREDVLTITLTRHPQEKNSVNVTGDHPPRRVAFEGSYGVFRSALLLALQLPEDIYALMEHELVWPPSSSTASPDPEALDLYRESLCYRLLETLTETDDTEESDAEEPTGETAPIVPQPAAPLLEQLKTEYRAESGDKRRSIDRLLADVLFCPPLESLEIPEQKHTPRNYERRAITQKQMTQQLLKQAETFGIPNFPEQYLYFLEKPQMRSYEIAPPLTEKSNFLGEFILIDDNGQAIEGFGEELEQALMFCSQTGKKEFELPLGREQINIMLSHYRKDLNALYDHIRSISFSHYEDAREARKLANKAWKKLLLPAPAWFRK